MLEMESEQARSREKACLERELTKLKTLYEQLLHGMQEAEAEAIPTAERCSELEQEVGRLQSSLCREREAHAELSEYVDGLRGQLEAVEEHCQGLESKG